MPETLRGDIDPDAIVDIARRNIELMRSPLNWPSVCRQRHERWRRVECSAADIRRRAGRAS